MSTFFFLFLLPSSGSSASASPLYMSPPSLRLKTMISIELCLCFFVSTSLFVGRIECSWAVDLSTFARTSVVESATRATSDDSMLMKLRESDNSHWPCWWWGLCWCWCWCWWQQMNDLTPQQQILPTQALGEDLSAPVLDSQYITHHKNSPRFKL